MKCMKFRSLVLASVAALAVACGVASGSNAANVSGTFAGQPLSAVDTAAFTGMNGNTAYLGEIMASASGVCSVAQKHAGMANASRLELFIQSFGAESPTLPTAGHYAITNGDPAADTNGNFLNVSADYNALDAKCYPTIADTTSKATSGSITVEAVSSTRLTGTFDLTFPNGDHLRGSFDSPLCTDQMPQSTPSAGGADAPTQAVAQGCVQ